MSEQNTTEDATSEVTEDTDAEISEPTEGEADLGNAGKQALDRMKAERNKAITEAKAAKARAEAAEAALANKDKPADEVALDTARAEATKAATDAANLKLAKSALRLAAKGVLADPADAIAFIDATSFEVDADGEVDSGALAEAITDLLERKPHLAAGKPTRFEGGADQGAKGKSSALAQITDAQLQSMSPAEINKARREGRLDKVLGKTP